jgi:ubiquinone/menaquinone biosynthesis C-methylase UbiE
MNNKRVSVVDWEKDIYAKGKQLNNWPYTDVISDIIRLTKDKDRKKLKILEIGCGTCNNLWFAAELGLNIHGLDLSKTAIDYGKTRLENLGFKNSDLRVGDITQLDWDDNYFDIVLDRGALTQNNYDRISSCLKEIKRTLKDDGLLLSYTLFGLNSSDIKFGKEVSKNTFDHFSTETKFSTIGLTSFFNVGDLKNLFSEYQNLEIKRNLKEDLSINHTIETYSVICNK